MVSVEYIDKVIRLGSRRLRDEVQDAEHQV